MGIITLFLLCSFVVGTAQSKVTLDRDRPYLRKQVSHEAKLECCYTTGDKSLNVTWVKQTTNRTIHTVHLSEGVTEGVPKEVAPGKSCGTLTFYPLRQCHSGLYRCKLRGNNVNVLSHGTYLQIYKPMEKTINLSETTKNTILTAEGVLLLLCVLLPSISLLSKSKRLNVLEKNKITKEEENIYQGLNLDECWSTYDQIERPQTHGQYQDVGNLKGKEEEEEEEEEIQLEKP
ncbi:B-cell antigen receptor complex-associated protein alpha chain [Notothenia coriiceps]|uniref:B-cell antigen receptor complex-associated protein alpha chain n=1 Tax=Notothenia coriiceps TaxID=8208 RepID=A0A6I9NSV7_9TELE|nr:PREDICTED: B-cell antigen receptor complex-associated protein alpha chain [Notothenia coriiceps]